MDPNSVGCVKYSLEEGLDIFFVFHFDQFGMKTQVIIYFYALIKKNLTISRISFLILFN